MSEEKCTDSNTVLNITSSSILQSGNPNTNPVVRIPNTNSQSGILSTIPQSGIPNTNSQSENSNTKEWNEAVQQTVLYIGESSKGYKIMHLHNAVYYSFMYSGLMYSVIILTSISGFIATMNAIFQHPTTNITLSIIIAVLALLIAILSGISKFSRYNEKSDSHKAASSKYSSLEMNVRTQLSLDVNNREDANRYLKWLSKSLDDVFMSAPFISKRIYRKYVAYAKTRGLVVPEAYDDDIDLEVGTKINMNNLCNESDIKTGERVKEKVPRKDTYLPFTELNSYNEDRMKYEMQRFIRM